MKHVYKVEFEGWEIDSTREEGGVFVNEQAFVVAINAQEAIQHAERIIKKQKGRKFDWLEPSQVIRHATLTE